MKQIKNGIYSGSGNRKSVFDLSTPTQWNNKLIVFMHGYMGHKDWGCWNLVEDYFKNYSYGFLKYNVSHNGGTIDKPIDFNDLDAFSQNNYLKEIEDFEAIISLIQAEFKVLPEIYIIGHSRGGGIALLQAENKYVAKITSWAGIASIAERMPTGTTLQKWKNDGYYYRKNGRTHQEMPHAYSQYESFIKNQKRLSIKSYCEKSNTPTLIIHGDKDLSVKIDEGQKVAKWLNTNIIQIKGAQHTFGSSHPWESNILPKHLLEVCKTTLDFFDSKKE
ncbi:MAG: prolyl oligopeptidase family serine peptidase [Crocinitomicaceae bacterium]|nr:prolyl oligopeptidase family serine peptidase [Crocinitomicaceae bacterium]MDG1777059.1 prolyl oligopeptidase family serine peptidase [Crocinitomicaceae bacterium]